MKHKIDLLLLRDYLEKNGMLPLYPNGWSMVPFIKNKEKVFIQKVECESIRRGDIVVFYPSRKMNQLRIHRVIKIYKKGEKHIFLIKGDSCFLEDGFIPSKRIIGKVISIVKENKRLDFNTIWMRLFNYLLSIYSFIIWYEYRHIIKKFFIQMKNPFIKNLLFRIAWISMIDIPKSFIEILLILSRIGSKNS